MSRKPKPAAARTAADVEASSIEYLATSIEAIGARLRLAIGKPNAWRVLGWAADELERLGCESRDIGDEARTSEAVGS